MTRLIEFAKRFVAREPLLVRTAAGLLAGYAVTLLHLDPALKGVIVLGIVGAVATWCRSKVSPSG